MSGQGTFSGTVYQQRVAAYVGVQMLAQAPLCWFGSEDDTPSAFAVETGGPGDDLSVVLLRDSSAVFEVQAKHGLSGGARLRETVETIAHKHAGRSSGGRVVLAVDASASRSVRIEFAQDLDRLRSGRTDGLKADAQQLLQSPPTIAGLLASLWVRCVDVDEDSSPNAKECLTALRAILQTPEKALTAWRLLVDDAGSACRTRQARRRQDLETLLRSNDILVRPLAAEEFRRLDFCDELLRRYYVAAAKDRLASLARDASERASQDPEFNYRLWYLHARCALLGGDFRGALGFVARALETRPEGYEALRIGAVAHLREGDLTRASVLVDRAMAAAPHDARCWAIRLSVETAAGKDRTIPPALVSQSLEYRIAEIEAALDRGCAIEALAITEGILKEGKRAPEVRLLRARALLADLTHGPEDAQEVETLCGDVIAELENEADPRLHDAIGLRAAARSERGDGSGAEDDIARLRETSGKSPDVLRHAAVLRARAGDLQAALAILAGAVVDADPCALAMRANVKVQVGDIAGGRRDAADALRLLGQPHTTTQGCLSLRRCWLSERTVLVVKLLRRPPRETRSTHCGWFCWGVLRFARGG